jgi:hypothetical protein
MLPRPRLDLRQKSSLRSVRDFFRALLVARVPAIAAALAFAAFVVAKGVPTLRHDWNWPIDRVAIPSFFDESVSGWLSNGFGIANAHPTTYLLALPVVAAMWIFGPLAALALLALATGYGCMRAAAGVASRWGNAHFAAVGIGLFALFNPWVYNEVVAGHLTMVLAYGALIGLFSEMTRGTGASAVRLALWLALVEIQLQFFIIAVLAVAFFAAFTRKWSPLIAGAIVALPSVIGILAERATLLQIPYSVEWQTNQSVDPLALLSLNGYFPRYAARLGLAAQVAVWGVCALALVGVVAARRRRTALWAGAGAGLVYLIAIGVNGPLAAPYVWIVRQIPESGVFRELYDLAGVFAALLVVLACAATASVRLLGYVSLAAGIALSVTWLLHPPSDFWIGARAYPHPSVTGPPFSRVALMPAFQPLQLRDGGGDGADPDVFRYPSQVAPLNEYFPTYPVDVALARYEQTGDVSPLRALGVATVVERPWLVSRSNGAIGLAASSLAPPAARPTTATTRYLADATPLISQCDGSRIVALVDRLGACDVFLGDASGYAVVRPVAAQSNSIDARSAWIDARLAFARAPALAQGIGGAVTQSSIPHAVEPGSWVLAFVRGRLSGSDGRNLVTSHGAFVWLSIPGNVTAVSCAGLCELVAESRSFPAVPLGRNAARTQALPFQRLTPWLYRVHRSAGVAGLVRLNERFDPGWVAVSGWRVLPHLRVDLSVNGWVLADGSSSDVILVQVTALLQLLAELAGLVCVLLLLKALVLAPTKRA